MSEIWKPVAGFEGLYEVSNTGHVRSVTRDRDCGITGVHHYEGRELTLSQDAYGYLQCVLSDRGRIKKAKVHRLVAYAFIPQIEGKEHVNHIDGDKQNNNVENLEWCTIAENNRHAYAMGLMRGGFPRSAIDNSAAKRSKAVVRSDGARFVSAAAASRVLGVASSTVAKAIRWQGQMHTVKGYSFKWEADCV